MTECRPSATWWPTRTRRLVIVARFLALLELFKEGAIAFEQPEALGALTVRWTGSDAGEVDVSEEFDETEDSR